MIPGGPQQPQQVPIQLNVSTNQAGLAKVKGDFLGLAGDLAEPILVLASGGSKVEAAWSGIKGVLEARVLGPLSFVAGGATAALIGIGKLAKGFAEMGMAGAAGLQSVETRFKSVLRSQELAAERIRENVNLAKETPYTLEGVNEASRSLEILTQGALSTVEGMKLVGDANAVAGEELENTAKWVGRLYDALQSGAPIGEASMRLQEMGVINGQTRRTLETMVDSGASFAEMWGVVEGQLKKSEGAMKDLSKNLEGLNSTYQDTVAIMQAKFSAGFIEGEMASVEAATKAMEAMTPTVETLGTLLGAGSNKWEKFKAGIVDSLTSMPGFSKAMTAGSIAIVGFLAAISAGGIAAILRFAGTVIATTLAKNRMIRSTGALVVAEQAQVATTTQLTSANVALAAAVGAVTQGNYKLAAAEVKTAAVHTMTAVKTSGATVAAVGLSGGLRVLTGALGIVTGALRAMFASLLVNPFFLAAAALIAVGAALLAYSNHLREARERSERFAKATDDIVTSLQSQQRAIKTTTDLLRTHNAAVNELANSRKELAALEADGTPKDVANAKKRVAAIESELAAINNFDRAKLAMTDDEKADRVKRSEDGDKLKQLQREEARAKMSPKELAIDLQKEADEQQKKFERANREVVAQKTVQEKQSSVGRQNTELSADLGAAEGELRRFREIKAEKEELVAKADRVSAATGQPVRDREAEAFLETADEQEKEILSRIESLREKVVDAKSGLREALSGDSEIEKFKARIALRNQESQASGRVEELRGQVKDAGEDVDPALLEQLDLEERSLKSLISLAEQYRVALDAGAQSRDETDLEIAKERLARERDIVALREKQAAARKAADEASFNALNAQMDTAKAILGLKDLGLAGDLKAIEYEQRKLDLALQRKRISQDEYDQKTAILAAEAEATREAARKRSVEAVADTQINQLRTEEEWARRIGDTRAAAAASAQADALELAQIERKARQEAKEMFSGDGDQKAYVDQRMAVERRAQEQARRIREEESARKRRQSSEDQALTYGELRAEVLRYQGQTRAAEAAERDNDKLRDKRLAEDRKKEYVDQGFSAEEAEKMAGRDVTVSQAQRELEKLKSGGRGEIIASSMVRIGGGGNVVGTDPVARRLDESNRLLKIIAENSGGDMKTPVK